MHRLSRFLWSDIVHAQRFCSIAVLTDATRRMQTAERAAHALIGFPRQVLMDVVHSHASKNTNDGINSI